MKNLFRVVLICFISLVIQSCNSDDDNTIVKEIVLVKILTPKLEKESTQLLSLYKVATFLPEDYINNTGVTFSWWSASDKSGSDAVKISGATTWNYTKKLEDADRYIAVEIEVEGAVNKKKRSDFFGPITDDALLPK